MSKLKIVCGHGGYRPGAGRPKGAKDRKPRAPRWDSKLMRDIEAAAHDEPDARVIALSPKNPSALAVIQSIYRNDRMPTEVRAAAARACLPFESKRQPVDQNMDYQGDGLVRWLTELAEKREAGLCDEDDDEDEPTEP